MNSGILGVIALVVVLVWLVWMYNRLVRLKNGFLNAYSQIDVQLQRRHELVPNLVAVAKAYLDHENETLLAVTAARNTAEQKRQHAADNPAQASRVNALAKAESALVGQLGQFRLVVEDYPDLKANQTLDELQRELGGTEDRVAFARQAYSDAVMRYNMQCEEFPDVLVARLCAFLPADLFELGDERMREAVKVSFA